MDELILELIDFNVEDEFDEDEEEGTITIYGDPKSYAQIQKFLEEQGFEDIGGEFTYIPNDLKDVDDEARATIDKMVERLEEFDDFEDLLTFRRPNPCYIPTLDATFVSCHLFDVFRQPQQKSVFSKLLFVLCVSLSISLIPPQTHGPNRG